MSGLIGGSGSTGSSLLRQILNRHSELFCGPETSLFCKPALYSDWNSRKHHILSRGYHGLKNHSFHIYRGVDIIKEEMGVDKRDVQNMAKSSHTFKEFVLKLYNQILIREEKSLWLEKTPSNAYTFKRFLDTFEEGVVIHIFRNPYDTIASLYNRGFSHYQATSIYLLNTAYALRSFGHKRYYQLSYEDLIMDTEQSLGKLCAFLHLPFQNKMIQATSKSFSDDPTKIGKWGYDEGKRIGKKSIGKFHKLSEVDQDLIQACIQMISIAVKELELQNLGFKNVSEIGAFLGYDIKEESINDRHKKKIRNQRYKDVFKRTRKASHYQIFNNPIQLVV